MPQLSPGGPPPRDGDIADPGLAELGDRRIQYAARAMPLLSSLAGRFAADQPFQGMSIAACLHVTAETAVLARTLRAGGARVTLAASNPLSTQDDVAAALASLDEMAVYARAGVDRRTYYDHIALALGTEGPDSAGARGGDPPSTPRTGPDLVIDDGGDLIQTLHTERSRLLSRVMAGCEGTTTGVLRLRRMAAEGALAFPMIAASDTPATRLMENLHGTGQSVIDGLLRASGILLAGKTVVVAGFGTCGTGIAEAARGLGARVMITEVDPVRALDAMLRGFRVLPLADAAPIGEVFVTATGSAEVITAEHMAAMRDGAILANAGHFDVEIDVRGLADLAIAVYPEIRPHCDAYELPDGRRLLLLAEGRVVNVVAAEGHPAEVMDLAFGIEALALAWLARNAGKLSADVHPVPPELDAEAARLVLTALGAEIDSLTPAQRAYLASWRSGSLSSRGYTTPVPDADDSDGMVATARSRAGSEGRSPPGAPGRSDVIVAAARSRAGSEGRSPPGAPGRSDVIVAAARSRAGSEDRSPPGAPGRSDVMVAAARSRARWRRRVCYHRGDGPLRALSGSSDGATACAGGPRRQSPSASHAAREAPAGWPARARAAAMGWLLPRDHVPGRRAGPLPGRPP